MGLLPWLVFMKLVPYYVVSLRLMFKALPVPIRAARSPWSVFAGVGGWFAGPVHGAELGIDRNHGCFVVGQPAVTAYAEGAISSKDRKSVGFMTYPTKETI